MEVIIGDKKYSFKCSTCGCTEIIKRRRIIETVEFKSLIVNKETLTGDIISLESEGKENITESEFDDMLIFECADCFNEIDCENIEENISKTFKYV